MILGFPCPLDEPKVRAEREWLGWEENFVVQKIRPDQKK